jgi:hypothetical protein
METYLATTPVLHLVRGTFDPGTNRVQWESLGRVPAPSNALQRTRLKQRASER